MRESNETAEDVWTRILQTETIREIDDITPTESKFSSVFERSTGDYKSEKQIKNEMAIEIMKEHFQYYKYRSKDSNKSIDGNVQKRPQTRNRSKKSGIDRNKRRPENQSTKLKDNWCGTCRATTWTGQHNCSARALDCRNCNQKRRNEQSYRLLKRNQHLDRAIPSVEKDRWNYQKLENVKNNKKKGNAIT